MRIWNTKYALTRGIVEQEATQVSMTTVKNGVVSYLHGEGKEWHRTQESAVIRAEEMRTKKIAQIKRKIAKLEAMTFKDTPS